MPQHGNAAVVHDVADEGVAATGDNQVDERILLEHGGHVLPAFHQLGEIRRESDAFCCCAKSVAQGGVGVPGLAPALEQHGVAALEGQGGNLHQRVRATLEDHADHADGAGNPVQLHPLGQLTGKGGLPDGVGQLRQGTETLRHSAQLLLAEFQPTQKRCGQLLPFSGGEVLAVGCKNGFAPGTKGIGHGQQRSVAFFQTG